MIAGPAVVEPGTAEADPAAVVAVGA